VEANAKAEDFTFNALQKAYSAAEYEILQKPVLKFDGVSGKFNPDFVVLNKKT